MQHPTANKHHPAHMSNEQVVQMLRAAIVEVSIRAGDEALERIVREVREALDEDTVGRMRDERDQMLFVTAVLADIAALPGTEELETGNHGWGTYL